MNQNINRWVQASVYKHFKTLVNFPLYIGRYDREASWSELRVGGPYEDAYNRGCARLDYNIDILITVFPNDDLYEMQRITGMFQEAFTTICVLRYGDGEMDDSSLVGALNRSREAKVNVTNFGLLLPDAQLERSSVECDFSLWLPK